MKQGKRVVLVTGSVNFFENEIKPWLEQEKIYYKWYKQANGNDQDLLNINVSWSQHQNQKRKRKLDTAVEEQIVPLQLIAYTNRITVGLSYELEDVDDLYIYGMPGSILPRLLFQMKGRIRFLKNDTISVYIFPRKDEQVLTSFDQLQKNFLSRRQILSFLKEEDDQKHSWASAWIKWQKDYEWVARQYCYDELEINLSKNNFLFEMIKLCIHHGLDWIFLSCFHSDPLLDSADTQSVLSIEDVKKEIEQNSFELFSTLKLVTPLHFKEYPQQNQKEKLQIRKSKLYYTFILHDFVSRGEKPTAIREEKLPWSLSLEQNKILWEFYKIYNNKSLRKKVFHNLLIKNFPKPEQWTGLLNQGSIFHIGQEFFPKQVALYKILYHMITSLGWKHVADYESIVSTQDTLTDERKRKFIINKISEYQTLREGYKESKPANLPGLLRKISLCLKNFSGQEIIPYCVECDTNGPCAHIKKGREKIVYKQIKKIDSSGKQIKLYCFTYKIKPSQSDDLLASTKEIFSFIPINQSESEPESERPVDGEQGR